MRSPSHSRAATPQAQRGRWRPARRDATTVHGEGTPAQARSAPLRGDELRTLRRWLVGGLALRPREAEALLERAVAHRQLVDEPALHWKAVKARVVGPENWAETGHRLTLD